ncbi:D-TA family PLP-dependent enzyme [Candidatus Poribacteria bacterium]|nr:D-TA family PLP-dependent enzyme [Candidatus Poribacteria bacterium]
MHINDLDTPALLADLDVLEKNISNMAKHCSEIGIPLRVHTKTHKVPEIAKLQVETGSKGITCQKLGEAEVMVDAEIDDILIPYNIVGKPKLQRLTDLVKRAKVIVALDSEETASGISQQATADGCVIPVIVELDTGSRRCGVGSPLAAHHLAQKAVKMPGLDFQGVMTYPSNVNAKPFITETVNLLRKDGIPVNVISGGGTGSEIASKEIGCTETRSGSYVYEEMTRVGNSEMLSPERCVLRVLVTVVSTPSSDRIIIDGGQKTFASYPPTPYGHIIEHPDAKIYGMSVEHGHVDVSGCSHKFRVGERLSVIPLHQGMTSNLHDELVGVRINTVETKWQIAGRGKVK